MFVEPAVAITQNGRRPADRSAATCAASAIRREPQVGSRLENAHARVGEAQHAQRAG